MQPLRRATVRFCLDICRDYSLHPAVPHMALELLDRAWPSESFSLKSLVAASLRLACMLCDSVVLKTKDLSALCATSHEEIHAAEARLVECAAVQAGSGLDLLTCLASIRTPTVSFRDAFDLTLYTRFSCRARFEAAVRLTGVESTMERAVDVEAEAGACLAFLRSSLAGHAGAPAAPTTADAPLSQHAGDKRRRGGEDEGPAGKMDVCAPTEQGQ